MSGNVSGRFWGSQSEMSYSCGDTGRYLEQSWAQSRHLADVRDTDVIMPYWGAMLNYNCYLMATPPRTVLELNNFQLLMPQLSSMQLQSQPHQSGS